MLELNPLETLTEKIQIRKKQQLKKKNVLATLSNTFQIFILLVILIILFNTIFSIRLIKNNNMFPYINDGDLVLLYFKPQYLKNEIVIYQIDGKEYCGRIVAKTGDKIDFSNGKLYVNDIAQVNEILFITKPPADWETFKIIPNDSVYILSDYRLNTDDSRRFGFINMKDIKYKIILTLRYR